MKKEKVKKVVEEKPEQTIFDLVQREAEMTIQQASGQPGKVHTRVLFKMWCVLPDVFKGATERIISLLGYQDPIVIELLKTSTMLEFADKYGVSRNTLGRWKNEIETADDYMTEVRKTFKPLTKNVMASLYRKMLEEGDGPRFKAYFEVIEGWKQQLGIEHSGVISDGLSTDERTALDKLLAKNTS